MATRFEDGPPGYHDIYRENGREGARARVAVRHAARSARDAMPPTRRLAAASVGAAAVGVLAVGAFAIGALAISRLAINRMGLRQGHIQSLTIDELRVRRLRIDRQDGPDARPRYASIRRV
ncbi:hypothetical protein [Salinarimonas rosea]|uniref:hypothetical protein n=1 Tax=Salinarimonas rosea TaxID=552063 RepID=UPI00040FA93D|nr:hypothetical protein [Salinarimonas rosea]